MTDTLTQTAPLRARLVDELSQRGFLRTDRWRKAFLAVPRDAFVEDFTTLTPDGPVHWSLPDPDALDTVYRDQPLITETDNGGTPTSSSTAPSLMALMLERLDPTGPVLEIGTGTGYNAALLTHVLGDQNVTTCDMHPALAHRARNALNRLGYRPTVVHTNGTAGHPDHAPYEHLLATCATPRLPTPWRHQLRPGGTLLLTLGHALAHLTLDQHHHAAGPLIDYASFMPARPAPDHHTHTATEILTRARGVGARRTTPALSLDDLKAPAFVALRALHLPHLQQVIEEHPGGDEEFVLLDHATGSWARARHTGEHLHVTEAGPLPIWHTVEQLHTDWTRTGRPDITAYHLTVTDTGHTLTHQDSAQSWLLP